MENKIIDINKEAEENKKKKQEEVIMLLEELNNKVADKDGGQWVNTEDYGLCWHPNRNRMENPLGVPSPSVPPPALEGLVEWGNKLDVDSIPQNAVIVIKLDVDNPVRANIMAQIITNQVLQPRTEILKEKHVCVLFLGANDSIDILTEAEMNKAGWEKKEPSRIITLS